MKIFIQLFALIILLFPSFLFAQSDQNYVSLHLKNETYQKGRIFTMDADYFYNSEKGNLVVKSAIPEEHIKISNRLGEIKIYYPDKNQVLMKQSQYFSSENELVYYFLTNNYYDLGLAKQGFSVTDTHMDNNYQVVIWSPPSGITSIEKVEIVFEDGTPIYSADYNNNGKIEKKTYYYNYNVYGTFMFPEKVTQISYTQDGDSIIQRNTWSQIKTSAVPDSDYFNFKIPEDAKVITQ